MLPKLLLLLPMFRTSVLLRSKLPALSGLIRLDSDTTDMKFLGKLLMAELPQLFQLETKELHLLDSLQDQPTPSPSPVLPVLDQDPLSPHSPSPLRPTDSKESKTPTVKRLEPPLFADGTMAPPDTITLSSLLSAPEARDKRSSSLLEETSTESTTLATTATSKWSQDTSMARHKSSLSIFKLVNLQYFFLYFPFL